MINIWRRYNLIKVFKAAYEKGIILSGISAGDLILEEGAGVVDDQQKVQRIQ